jgi:allophanate hydrolase
MPDSPALTTFGNCPAPQTWTADLTTDEVVESLLSRLSAQADTAVWIDLLPRAAVLDQVRAVQKRHAAGEVLPLRGVPFAVKDNIDCAGRPTTAACPAFAYVPSRSAPPVSRFVDAGAILVGKTNLAATSLASSRRPVCCQPQAWSPLAALWIVRRFLL